MSLSVKGQGENRKVTVKGNKKPCLIYCHGDSVTANSNSYAGFLKNIAQSGAPISVTVVNAATSGQNMIYLLANLQTQVLQYNPDVITLCVLLNELGDTSVSTRITDYVTACLAHTNPNGKKPFIFLMTDNFCGQNIGLGYARTQADQDAAHTRIITVYNSLAASNSNIRVCDNYPVFKALGVDTPQLYAVLDSASVHPNDAGVKIITKNLSVSFAQLMQLFYNS